MLLVALVVGIVNFLPAQAAGGHWTISSVAGTAVMVVNDDQFYDVQRGHPVMAGASIVTGEDGTVVLVRRGDSMTVYPNSEMTIPTGSAEAEAGVMQSFGRMLFRMETRESRNFKVQTPFLAATIKGTVFTVDVGATEARVEVSEGLVRVEPTRGGRSEAVRAGWAATARASSGTVALARNARRGAGGVLEAAGSLSDESTPDVSVEPDVPPKGDRPAKGKPSAGAPARGSSDRDSKPGKSKRDKSPTRGGGNPDGKDKMK